MHCVLVALWAVLLDFKTVWIITTILTRNVVTILAVFACQSNLWTNIILSHVMCLSLLVAYWLGHPLALSYRGPDLNRRHSDYEPLALPG